MVFPMESRLQWPRGYKGLTHMARCRGVAYAVESRLQWPRGYKGLTQMARRL